MVLVLTADQRDSRHRPDSVEQILRALATIPVTRDFERTAGDELQGVLSDPLSVVQAILVLMDTRSWHVGIGVGPVEDPLPASTRQGRGPAFLAARHAVDRAKRDDSGIEVHVEPNAAGAEPNAAGEGSSAEEVAYATADATAGCQLLADLLQRRTDAGREAVALVRSGRIQSDIAEQLGISRQAVGQRLTTARWPLEQATIPMLTRLIGRAERLAASSTHPQRRP